MHHPDDLSEERALSLERRGFLGLCAGGILVLVRSRVLGLQAPPESFDTWVRLEKDGTATALSGKVDYGQGIRGGFALIVAEELGLPPERVRVVLGDTDQVPFDRGTWGSESTQTMHPKLRAAAARAALWLKRRAAKRWGVAVNAVRLEEGRAVGPGGRTASFADLVAEGPIIDAVDADAVPVPPGAYRTVGRAVHRPEGRAIVTGEARYAADRTVPGLLHAAILRPPFRGARLTALDERNARASPGVVEIVRAGDLVAVVAKRESQARRAVRRLEAKWEGSPPPSSEVIAERLKAAGEGAAVLEESGDRNGWNEAAKRLEAVYETAFVYPATMEPQAALIDYRDGEAWVEASTQRPFAARDIVARALGLPREKVHVRMPFVGSGYGRKNALDAVEEAAAIAARIRKPVRVVWTRAEDFQLSTFRQAMRISIRAALDGGGKLVAWDYLAATTGSRYGSARDAVAFYPAGYKRTRIEVVESGVRSGSFRGLGAPMNAFARECFIDELAFAAGKDPLHFRLGLLGGRLPRMAAVLQAAVERSGWKPRAEPRRDGTGWGLACAFYRERTYVAQAAKVRVEGDTIRVENIVAAVDCGLAVNPDGVRSQIEGGATMAASYTLGEEARFRDGRMTNGTFRRYPILRAPAAPKVDVVIISRPKEPPVGVGEPGSVPTSAAIANAVFDATGKRRRRLPLSLGT